MITLRKLQLKDVPLMLEWMHDEEAKHIFQNNFAEIDDVAAKKFVENSFREDQQHFAIVDDQDDEYLGTISLKNIDLKILGTIVLNFESGNKAYASRRYIPKIKEFLEI